MIFIDKLRIYIEAGAGGDGCSSFRREKYIPFGGPNGGNGGNGGNVYLIASKNVNTFYKLSFHPQWKAGRGGHGEGNLRTGANGEDARVPVPLGTLVYDVTSAGKRVLLGELLRDGEEMLVAKGGRGGRGNAAFKSSTNQAPKKKEEGQPGEKKTLELELKLLGDVGLLGLPNAGKSTLLARLTRAKPKIANYPFTTLSPTLGVCEWKGHTFVIADIPGLIEGAHQGKGLGDEFLRHVERAKLLVHLIDPLGFSTMTPLEGLRVIEREIKLWNQALTSKPRILAVTKSDLGDAARKIAAKLKAKKTKMPVFVISAHTGEGIESLLDAMTQQLSQPENKIWK